MVPSSKWFPLSFAERVVWYNTFAQVFATMYSALGFTNADLQQVQDDNAMMQFLGDNVPIVENYSDAVRSYRRVITEGDVDGTTPDFPTIGTITPGTPVPQGIFERLDNLVKRIRLAPNYTEEEGEQLGIIPKKGQSIAPETAKPAITAATDPGNVIFVKFKKGQFSGVFLQTSVDKGNWQDQGRFTRSPIEITIPQNQDELPRMVALRARYLVGDNAVGEWSDTVTVQTTP
jgi:hypothetical protein